MIEDHPLRIWTRESIICAIQRWVMEYGEPPTSRAWMRAVPGYPSKATVREVFGTFNKGIQAAGYRPRPRGCPGHLDPEWTKERFNPVA